MAFNLKTFLLSSAIFIALAVATLAIFPLQKPTTSVHYDYKLHQDVPDTQLNLTGILLLCIEVLGMFAWLAHSMSGEQSIVRTPKQILRDPRCSPDLSDFDIIPSEVHRMESKDLGEYSIGYLVFMWVLNQQMTSVFIVAIGNDNYRTTEARQRFECPIRGISIDPRLAVENAANWLPPGERRNLFAQYKSVSRKLAEIDPELREKLLEQPEKQLKEEEEST